MIIISNNSKYIIYSIKLVLIIYESIATMKKKRLRRHVIGLFNDELNDKKVNLKYMIKCIDIYKH